MRKILLFSLTIATLWAAGCTSEEGKLKKQAISTGELRLQQLIQQEALDGMPQSSELRQGYQDFIMARSEVVTDEPEIIGGSAVVSVAAMIPPVKLRKTLIAIAGKLDSSKARRFNFGEAVSLIKRQTGEDTENTKQGLGIVKFVKQGEAWVQSE
ncbi:hypothetical protein [Bdellovibrio reynosensis]|uniref:Lipoprotein n=1 Tax=Bdellovibrio reynosensis TaxID=2835041 RepID=A0ABY4CGV5_9BACT|nr:hypothetical protein [Bdellovibrio reynosensis]UOF02803.1 hypothetical protein MNR06_07540 [Bdellovibrio reynosensis]